MATNRNSLAPEMVAFLQTLDSGNLYRIAFGKGNDIEEDLMTCEDGGSLEPCRLAKCPFEEELLQRAVDAIPEEAVFKCFSKAAIVARWLNANLVQNQGKSQDEWIIFYYSGYGS